MVKLLEKGGFRVYLYSPPREHEPPHLHVECSQGGEVTIRLSEDDAPPTLWQNHHMRWKNVREAVRLVEAHQQRFLEEWRRLHGRDS